MHDDGRHVLAGHRHRGEQHRRHTLDARRADRQLAPEQPHGELGGHPGLLTDRLVHGHVLVARNDPLHGSELGVLAGDRRDGVEARGAHRGDRTGGRAIVGGADADHPAAELGELALDPLPCLVRAPVRRVVLGEHRHARTCQHRGHACLDVCGVGVRRCAVHEQHALVRREVRPDGVHQGLTLQVAHPLDYFVAYDGERVGHLQGEALVDAVGSDLAPDQGVLLVNGASTDPNAADIKAGVTAVLAGAGVPVLAEYDTPDWSPDKAREWVEGQLTQYGRWVICVGAANDGTAAGAISAMRAAGLDPVPPVTGQDAELAAVQRIVAGNQYMTVYKAISQQARMAAELAVRLLRGELPVGTARVEGVSAVLLTPVAVTRENLASVIVHGGVLTVEQICTPAYRQACLDIGLLEEGDT